MTSGRGRKVNFPATHGAAVWPGFNGDIGANNAWISAVGHTDAGDA